MRKALRLSMLGGICASAIAIAAFGASTSGIASTTHTGGGAGPILKIGTMSQFLNPNPFNALSIMDYNISMLVYPNLVQNNSKGAYVGDLATSWSHTKNDLTWTFHLHKDAKWSDGKPLTSADVAWTFNTMVKDIKGGAALYAQNMTDVKSVSAPNPTTVVIHYSAPVAPNLAFLAFTPIVPEHIWKAVATGPDGAGLKTFKNSIPGVVAGGPFIPVQWNGTNFLLMKRNPDYYGPKPGPSEVGVQFYTTPDSLVEALKQNQINLGNNVPLSILHTAQKLPGYTVRTYAPTNYLTLYLNVNKNSPAKAIAQSQVVRHAMDIALNRKQMVATAYPGATPGESLVMPGQVPFYNPKVRPTYNPALANKLLDKLGFKRGSDGIRVANGQKMQYTMYVETDSGGAGQRVAQIIIQNMKAVGISITAKNLDEAAWLSEMYGHNNKYNTADMGLAPNHLLFDPSNALANFSCEDLGAFNRSGFCNKQYQKLYHEQSKATTVAQRKKLIDQIQVLMAKLDPALVLVYPQVVDIDSNSLTGFGGGPYGAMEPSSKITLTGIHSTG